MDKKTINSAGFLEFRGYIFNMSTAGHTLEEASAKAASRPKGIGWLRRAINKCLDSSGLRAPLAYEDEEGFHYGSIPLGEQERIARRNMSQGEEGATAASPSEKKQPANNYIVL
jgi:hypothetical protein